jgi:hypothetical protein
MDPVKSVVLATLSLSTEKGPVSLANAPVVVIPVTRLLDKVAPINNWEIFMKEVPVELANNSFLGLSDPANFVLCPLKK